MLGKSWEIKKRTKRYKMRAFFIFFPCFRYWPKMSSRFGAVQLWWPKCWIGRWRFLQKGVRRNITLRTCDGLPIAKWLSNQHWTWGRFASCKGWRQTRLQTEHFLGSCLGDLLHLSTGTPRDLSKAVCTFLSAISFRRRFEIPAANLALE